MMSSQRSFKFSGISQNKVSLSGWKRSKVLTVTTYTQSAVFGLLVDFAEED